MTFYLVLYDAFGNCQRVATASNTRDRDRFIEAGFTEVDEAEYQRCAAIAETARLSDLANLAGALSLLSLLSSSGATQQRVVPELDRDKVERLINQFQRNADKRTEDFFAGKMDIDQWYTAMASQIKRNRLATRAAAVGGFENIIQDDIEAARDATRRELAYLADFRKALEDGTLSERQARARARMYAGGARAQAEEAYQAAIGLPSLPAQPGVRTICHKNCKCSWDIQHLEGNGNFDCYWRRSPVDSCDTCRARERTFNPLQIRNGIIQPFSTAGIYA